MAYLDHINGKWHNRALGMSMTVERSTVEQVKRKLEEVKAKKQASSTTDDYLPDGVDRRILEAQEAEEREEEEKREAKKMKKQIQKEAKAKEEEGEAEEVDEEMMALMGFGGFK
jgi:U4/U6.U5 tri-snRNP component SNU23